MISILIGFHWLTAASSLRIIEIENDLYKISISEKKIISSTTDQFKFVFSIYDKTTKRSYFIEMKNLTTDIQKFNIYKDKIIVFGYVGSNISDSVTIIDLKSNKELDFILCYKPQLSETSRYLGFKKFYPRFSPNEVQSDLVLIYDLEKSPSDNRVDEKFKKIRREEINIASPEYTVLSENVGHPIYPSENVESQTYFVWIDSLEERHLITSSFLWLGQDDNILFIDQYKSKKWIVLIDISNGLGNITTIRKTYDDT